MLSLLFLSCQRIKYLETTLAAVRHHFSTIETSIPTEWICLDNGSSSEDRRKLESMGFDALILAKNNLGIGPAMNRLVSSVRTPYFLNLQDDWLLDNPRGLSFATECIKILESDRQVGLVKLDACHFLDFNDRKIYDGPFRAAESALPYFVQNPKMLWGGFTFPPAITRTEAVLLTGPFREDQPFRRGWAESEYSGRFSARHHAAKSPEMALFQHIGDQASPGWKEKPADVIPESGAMLLPTAEVRPRISAREITNTSRGDGRVSCLLTAYKRPRNLGRQLSAIKQQTVQPAQIAVWHNHHPEHQMDRETLSEIPHVTSGNRNWGVWPRFMFCQEFETEYVCVFDDDTIPGRRWLENCLETMKSHEGLLGTNGVIFVKGNRSEQAKVGWINPVNEAIEVDIVGHAWFFKREWLRCFASEPRHGYSTCGEDYHFSVAIQKHLGLGTYVPPHDPSDKTGWGSIDGELGKDSVALYLQPGEDKKKEETHNRYLDAGWKPISIRNGALTMVAGDSDSDSRAGWSFGQPQMRKPDTIAEFRFEQDFKRDFDKFDLYGKPFAFARFGDGEIALCTRRAIRVSDGWEYDGSDTQFSRELHEAVLADIPGYYLGISCRCCDPKGHQWYVENVRSPKKRITFANIFVNGNYERFKRLDFKRAALVSSAGGDFKVPRNAISPEFNYRKLLEKLFDVDRPILVAAGPLSCILIHRYWQYAPRPQVIIDIGSALDPVIHGRATRNYHHQGSPNASKCCIWCKRRSKTGAVGGGRAAVQKRSTL